jgi:hypothetical protein
VSSSSSSKLEGVGPTAGVDVDVDVGLSERTWVGRMFVFIASNDEESRCELGRDGGTGNCRPGISEAETESTPKSSSEASFKGWSNKT